MELTDKTNAILQVRPNAVFTLRGNEIEWLDTGQDEPTAKEILDGLVAYKAAKDSEAALKATEKAALLERLGITADEAVLLLS